MIIFLHIHKTGGTTFRSILEKNFGASCCHTNQTRRLFFTQADLDFANFFFPRLRAITGHNLVDPLQLSVSDPFYATFLREPVARVISHYQMKLAHDKKPPSFEASLQEQDYLRNWQVKLMAGGENLGKAKHFLERCNFVGLTEKFNLSLAAFDRLAPCKLDLYYRRIRIAQNTEAQKSIYANPQMLELARGHNLLDLQLYEFAIKEIFPKMLDKAGLKPDDTVPPYEVYKAGNHLRSRFGRAYNKVFRHVYRARENFSPPAAAKPA